MATKRNVKALRRSPSYRITEEAAERFRQMRALPNCSCTWGPRYYDHVECQSCDDWWTLQNQLFDELGFMKAWQYPVVHHAPSTPPHDEIAGGRTHRRDMPHAGGPEGWDKGGALFDALMRTTA